MDVFKFDGFDTEGVNEVSSCELGGLEEVTQDWMFLERANLEYLEGRCELSTEELYQSLVGAFGPPIDYEIKSLLCYGVCYEAWTKLESLMNLANGVSDCTCRDLDELYPILPIQTKYGPRTSFASWCVRNPGFFMQRRFDLAMNWTHFDAEYCSCADQLEPNLVACNSANGASWSVFSILWLVVLLHLGNFA